MGGGKSRPSVDEIYALLKKTSLPTVLVEGKDDIIFYRTVENDLKELEIDMLPAGNKNAVLELRLKIRANPVNAPIVFVVDNDLWVYPGASYPNDLEDVITTSGYSIENDLFLDGELESFLEPQEKVLFEKEMQKFARWYALSVGRNLSGRGSSFRTNPNKVLDDEEFYNAENQLLKGENYPDLLFEKIYSNYPKLIRGKSLFSLLLRQISAHNREIKFGAKQLMAVGAARRGPHFQRMHAAVKKAFEAATKANN